MRQTWSRSATSTDLDYRGRSKPGVQSDGGAEVRGPRLHQITELVRQPEAAPGLGEPGDELASDQRVGDDSEVGDLDDHGMRFLPSPQNTLPGAVQDTVGRHLMGRQHQVLGYLGVDSSAFGKPSHDRAE